MNLSQNLNVQLSQKLVLSHEMLQSLEIIQLPVLELKEKIDKQIVITKVKSGGSRAALIID